MNEEASEEEDLAYTEMMAQPATRGELFRCLQFVHMALLSQSLFHAATLAEDEKLQRDMAVQSVDMTGKLTKLMRDWLSNWKATDG